MTKFPPELLEADKDLIMLRIAREYPNVSEGLYTRLGELCYELSLKSEVVDLNAYREQKGIE